MTTPTMQDVIRVLIELRAAQEDKAECTYRKACAWRERKAKAQRDEAYNLLYQATKRVEAAELAADTLLQEIAKE